MEPVAPLLVAAAAFGGYLRFFRMRRRLGDARSVEAAWLAQHPGDEVRGCLLSGDGRAALVETGWGIGLVWKGGSLARRLDRARADRDAEGLVIHLPDADIPPIRLRLDSGEAEEWKMRIGSG